MAWAAAGPSHAGGQEWPQTVLQVRHLMMMTSRTPHTHTSELCVDLNTGGRSIAGDCHDWFLHCHGDFLFFSIF